MQVHNAVAAHVNTHHQAMFPETGTEAVHTPGVVPVALSPRSDDQTGVS